MKDPFSKLFRGRNSCRCFCVGLIKHLSVHQYSVYIFHIQEYWVLTESRLSLKPVLRDVKIVVLSISSHEHTQ